MTDQDIARETACATLGGLVTWEPLERADGRRARRLTFQSPRRIKTLIEAATAAGHLEVFLAR